MYREKTSSFHVIDCKRFMGKVDGKIIMETLLEGVKEGKAFIKKETLEPSLERCLGILGRRCSRERKNV